MKLFKCKICGREFNNTRTFSTHITKEHDTSAEQYYNKYVESRICPICNINARKFFNVNKGYYKTCGSTECVNEFNKNQWLKLYGVDNVSKLNDIKHKKKKTCLNKYGEVTNLKCRETKCKIKKTSLERYGVDWPSKSDVVKNTIKENNIKKYGVEYTLSSPEVRDTIKITNLKRYGTESGIDYNKNSKISHSKFIRKVHRNRPDIKFIKNTDRSRYDKNIIRLWKCLKCDTTFEDIARSTSNWLHPRCPTCNPIEYTSIENKVYEYINTIICDDDIIRCTRQVIPPYELDLYIPSNRLAIECDGEYWHSDEVLLNNRGMTYEEHKQLKVGLCSENGIILLNFTEYQINNEFDYVKYSIDKSIK